MFDSPWRFAGLMIFLLGITPADLPAQQNKKTSEQQGAAKSKAESVETKEITGWLAALDSKDFSKREEAVEKLIAKGKPALDFLKQLDRAKASPQTLYRVERVESAIEEKLSGFISFDAKANHQLTDRIGRFAGNTLNSLPRGTQKFANARFKISDHALVLGSRYTTKEITGIPVQKTCNRLHFLHAMQQGTGMKDGEKIGKYVVYYSDGKTIEIPIVYGEDVRDWWDADGSKKVSRGKVGWRGNNRSAESAGHTLRLYVSSWENKRPKQRVDKIDFIQIHSTASPFCVAITAESDNGK